ALGLAVLASLAAARSDSLQAAGSASLAALNGGYRFAFGMGAAFAGAAALIGAIFLRAAPPAEVQPKEASDASGRGPHPPPPARRNPVPPAAALRIRCPMRRHGSAGIARSTRSPPSSTSLRAPHSRRSLPWSR